MKSKAAALVVALAALTLCGALLDRVIEPVWVELRARQPALRLDAVGPAAGQGALLALLGGFRALVADATWIRMYVSWERRDLAATDTLVRMTPALDPRPLYFWLNGARIMANDFPEWRIVEEGGHEKVPPAVQQRIREVQGRAALEHLAAALPFHRHSAELWIERANIELNGLGDLAGAAESYRKAWEQPRAPYYTARLHAELLRRAGRHAEALTWLVELHPRLPRADEAAAADLVLSRIRDLERQLHVPPEKVYQPSSQP